MFNDFDDDIELFKKHIMWWNEVKWCERTSKFILVKSEQYIKRMI